MRLFRTLAMALVVLAAVGAASAQSQWQPVQGVPNIAAGAMALLTDGSVLVHDESGQTHDSWRDWYKLTPAANGDYATGTWSKIAQMPTSYGPLYFGVAVLPDGRVVAEGGEYLFGNASWTKLGAIYDPIANSWTPVNPPAGWNNIGDAQTAVLQNGTLMLANCCTKQQALLDPSTLTWTATGSGKFDENDEEGWVLLPGGKVMTVDAYVGAYNQNGKNYEIYDPASGAWTTPGSTPVQLWDSHGGAGGASYEVGPAVLRNDGTVYATGANGGGAGHTAIYDTSTGTWTAGPDFPGNLDIADGPAALEPNGKVIMMTSPGIFQTGAVFFEWDGSSLTQISGPPNAPGDSSYYGKMLVLPTGQIMFTDFSQDIELFTPSSGPDPAWSPDLTLTSAVLNSGTTYTFFGHKFNGASQAGAYGDDYQAATNYPIFRITSSVNGQVYYCRTHGHNTMAVGYKGPSYTHVDIPTGIPSGQATIEVIANGNPSQKYKIAIH